MPYSYTEYIKVVKRQLELNAANWFFKEADHYRAILEHVSPEQGNMYLRYMQDEFADMLKDCRKMFEKNDKYGKPIKHDFGEPYGTCSPTNWRYLFQACLILEYIQLHLQNKHVKFMEIGGGYGGLSLYLHWLAPRFGVSIDSYTIFDLEDVCKLARRYTGVNHVDINACSTPNETEIKSDDHFLISCYGFSELDEVTRAMYEKTVIPKCEHGFLVWNEPKLYPFTKKTLKKTYDERPNTAHNWMNKFVYF